MNRTSQSATHIVRIKKIISTPAHLAPGISTSGVSSTWLDKL